MTALTMGEFYAIHRKNAFYGLPETEAHWSVLSLPWRKRIGLFHGCKQNVISGHTGCFYREMNRPNREFCTMIKLDAGNVLLKPSHRRQMMAWLRRASRLGNQLGQFVVTITMHRTGKQCEVRAEVRDSAGEFVCRSRRQDWRDAMRELVRELVNRLQAQRLTRSLA